MNRFWLVIRLYFQRHLRRRRHQVILLITICLLSADSFNAQWLQPMRQLITQALYPVSYPVQTSFDEMNQTVLFTESLLENAEKLESLAEENQLLRQWYEYALGLQIENTQLKMYFADEQKQNFNMIRHFRLSRHDKSTTEPLLHIHLKEGQTLPANAAVISDNGLVGRIVAPAQATAKATDQATNTGARLANIMLLSHKDSSIPVQIGESGIQALLIGQGQSLAQLDYYHNHDFQRIQAGDRVVSSGFLGYMPSGLYIGRVENVTRDQITVRLGFDPSLLRYIGVIDITDSITEQQAKQWLQKRNKNTS